jgi:hypothetical protein
MVFVRSAIQSAGRCGARDPHISCPPHCCLCRSQR